MKKRFALLAALLIGLLGCLILGACGIKKGSNEDCKHPNATATVTQAATCTADGTKSFTCPDCEKTWTEKIPATGHSYAEDTAQFQAATCTEDGKKVEVCPKCKDSKTTVLPATGHSWEGFDCREKTCKNCDETLAPTAEHQWQGEACEEQVCKVCSETRPATAQHRFVQKGQPHELEGESYDATLYCHSALYTDYECSVCHESYSTLTQSARLHSVAEWRDSGTLTKKAGSTDCTYIGTRTGVCTECNKPVTETYEVAGRHTLVTVITEEATCTTDGTKTTKCSECGYVEKTEKFSDTNAHKWNAGTKQGNVTTYTCANDPTHTKTAIEASADEKQLSVSKDAITSADELVVGGAAIEMDAATKEGLTGENLTLGVDTLSASELEGVDESLSGKLEGKEVYNFTLGSDGDAVSDFNGKVTVRIPYELQPGEDVNAIVIWYVNGDKIENVTAIYSNGYVTFETEHFSYYTVSKYTPEEMCAKYGHNYVEQKRDATCVLSGYQIKVCTRCGDAPEAENKFFEKLGHDMQRVEAQCTVANCTTAGKTVEKCTRCNYQTTKVTPALGHKYDAVVTEATCTTGGYTTHTCSVCHESYKDTFTEAKGHSWNIPEPTCTEGQKCTVCGADGQKALGHSYVNGVCTRCGDGCTHEWRQGQTVEPTCTEKGYTQYTCSKCGFEKREESDAPLKDHNYENGKCTVCGATEPAVLSEYEKLVRSLKAERYTINAEDIAVSIISAYDGDSDQTDIIINKIEGALQLTESGELALHFTGDVDQIDNGMTYTLKFELILIDATAYLKAYDNGRESISRVPFDAMTADMEGPMPMILGYILDPEKLSGILAQVSEYGDTIVSVLGKLSEKTLLREDFENGYKYTFNNEKMRELNDNLYTLPISQFVDTYFGEGAYDSLKETVTDLLTQKTIPQAIDFVVEKAGEFGIEKETLFGLVDGILASVSGGEAPTVEDIYASEEYAEKTLGDMIESMAGMDKGQLTSALDSVFDMLEKTTAYGLLEQMMSGGHVAEDPGMSGGGSEMPMPGGGTDRPMAMAEEGAEDGTLVLDDGPTADFLHGIINAIFADKAFVFSFITDKDSQVKTFGLSVDLTLNMKQGEGTIQVDLNGGFTVAVNSGEDITVPDDFSYADEIVSILKEATKAAEGQRLIIGDSDRIGVFTLDGEKLTLTMVQYSSMYTFSDVEALEIAWEEDCTNTTAITFRGKPQEGRSSRSFEFYYNSVTGEFFMESAHDYQLEPTESQTEDEVGCDEYWVEVYYCSNCGKKDVIRQYKWHDTYYELSLIEGGKSCTDGVVHKEVCRECGETVYTYVDYPEWHPTMEKTLTIEGFPHGTVTFTYSGCPCGAESGELHQSEGDGCYFDKSAWEEYEGVVPEGHEKQVRRCAIEGCTAYMVWDRWTEKKDCIVTEYSKYTFFDGSEEKPIGDPNGYLFHNNSWENHDFTDKTIEHQSYANGGSRDVTEYRYNCGHTELNRTVTSEWKYDEYGRWIYHLYSVEYVNNPGENYCERESRNFTGCDYTGENYVKDSEGERTYNTSGTEHLYGGYVESTCTQFSYYDEKCPVCGEGEVRYDELPHGHEFYEEGDGLFRCMYCGLESKQGTDGVFALEEMTNESYKWGRNNDLAGDFVVGVWDKRDLGEDTLYQFSYVFMDENGEEQEVQLTLGEGDYKVVYRTQPMEGNGYNCYLLDISAEAVENALLKAFPDGKIQEKGWQPMGLRVTLVPAGTATGQVVSITLDRTPEQY